MKTIIEQDGNHITNSMKIHHIVETK